MYSKALNNFLKFLFLITFIYAIIVSSINNFISYETFSYLLSGKQIFINKFLPGKDDSSFVEKPIFNKSFWLFDLFAYLNAQYINLNSLKYHKILSLIFAFFIIFLIIYKRLQGKYITIALLPSSLAAVIIMTTIKFSPELFNIFFLSCFLYVLERNPSKRNKNFYFSLPVITFFWSNIDICCAFTGTIIMFFYIIYRYFDLKEQPEKEEKYSFKIFIYSFLLTVFICIFSIFFISTPDNLLNCFLNKNRFKYNDFSLFNISIYIYLLLYLIIFILNLKGADIGRKADFFKDISLSLFLLLLAFFNTNKIPFFLIFSLPVISYYTYLLFKWDFVWKNKWTERNLIFIKNIVYFILIPFFMFYNFYFEKIADKKFFPYELIRYINSAKIPVNIYHPVEIKDFLGYFLYPEYRTFSDNKKSLEENIKNFNLNTFIIYKNSNLLNELLNKNFKIAYFDDNFFVLVNPIYTDKYFKIFSPEKTPESFNISDYEKIKSELENFIAFYPSESSIFMLARIYKLKDINLAIKYLDEKIMENPSYSNLYTYLAQLLYEVEDFENAYEILKKLKKKNKEIIELMNKIKFTEL